MQMSTFTKKNTQSATQNNKLGTGGKHIMAF